MVYYQVLDVVGVCNQRVSSSLPELVRELGLRPVGRLERVMTLSGEEAMQLLRESHIFVHQDTQIGEVIISILSCKPFEIKKVIDYLRTELGLRGERYYSYSNL